MNGYLPPVGFVTRLLPDYVSAYINTGRELTPELVRYAPTTIARNKLLGHVDPMYWHLMAAKGFMELHFNRQSFFVPQISNKGHYCTWIEILPEQIAHSMWSPSSEIRAGMYSGNSEHGVNYFPPLDAAITNWVGGGELGELITTPSQGSVDTPPSYAGAIDKSTLPVIDQAAALAAAAKARMVGEAATVGKQRPSKVSASTKPVDELVSFGAAFCAAHGVVA